ncbi:uncharacterized protein [Branchiostoma lanceolatum]|uniref:uncharacterized protein isoform X2 n=1 Tax=Branchiostoma lanceolatum TaxID=7740 RepID=UPI00345287F3
MSTTGKRTSSEGTKDDKTKSKKSKKKLLPFLRRRLSEGNLFVKSSSFPKFSAEEKKLQPENKDAARAAENSCSGGELQICAVTTQVEDPAGGTAVTSETQEKPTKITSETDPAVRSPAGGEPRTSKGRFSSREMSPGRGQSPESSAKKSQSPNRGPSSKSGQSTNTGSSPKRAQSPIRKPSESRGQSPNRGPSPRRVQSPNKGASTKRGQSPIRRQSPKRGQSPSNRVPSPKRSQSPNRGPSLNRQGESPSRGQSPQRGHSPRRGPSLKRSSYQNNDLSPKTGQSPDSPSPKRGQSPNRKQSPKRGQSPSRGPPSNRSPKRSQSPDRRLSPKRGQTPDRGSFPERSRSPGSGSATTNKTDTSAVSTNLKKKVYEISDVSSLTETNEQLMVLYFSADQGTSLDVVLEQPEMELEETSPDLATTAMTGKDRQSQLQLKTVLDIDKINHEDRLFVTPSIAVENGPKVTNDSVEDVLPFQDKSNTSSSKDETVSSGSGETSQTCSLEILEPSEGNIREHRLNIDNTEKADEARPTVSGKTKSKVFNETGENSTSNEEETFSTHSFQENTEPQHVTKGPGCTPGHAATAVTDSSPGHAGSGNVEAVGAAGVRGHQDWQKLRNTQAENQPVDLHTTANHQHTEDLTAAKRIGTAPVSAGITANKRAETLKNTRTGKPSELEKQQVGFQPSQFKWIMDEQTDGSPCSGDSVSPGSETSTEFPAEIGNVSELSHNVLNAQEIQGTGDLSGGKYSCDGPGHDNTPAATQQQIKGIHHNKTMDGSIAVQSNDNSTDTHYESRQESANCPLAATGTHEVITSDVYSTESLTISEEHCESPVQVAATSAVVGYHGNPVNSLAEEIRLAETEDGGQKSQTESETVSQTDEHTENFLSTRHTTSSLEHSPSTLPDNSGPVKHPARGKKSSIPRRESTDSEKEEAGNSRRDALSRHPPLNGSGGGGKRTNSKTTKSKVSSKSQSMAPGGGSKAGMSGKRISRSTTSLPDGQHGNSSAQRGAQLPSLEETARLQDSTEKNMTWPKQKKTTKEDKKEELNNFRRTSSLRLPTKEKASFKRSVSFRLTERSESMSSLGSEASVGSKSDQPVSAAVAATRESVKKEWERRLHPHCPVPAPEPDKYLTPIQQKDFILRHMADLYKNMHKVISDRERQLVETEDDIRKLSEELSHREDDVIRMGTEIEMSASRVEDLTAEVRCLEAELAQHREAALSAQDEVSDEEYQRLEAQTELEEVRGQMEAAKRKASELQVAVDTRETLCAELHKKMNQLQADLKKRDQETQRRFLEMYEKGRAAEQFEQSENLLYDAMTAPAQVNVNALLRRIKQLEEQLIQARGDQRSESYRKGEKAESDVQVKLRVLRDAVFYYLVEREREQNLQMILEICNYNDKQKKMIIKTLKQKD